MRDFKRQKECLQKSGLLEAYQDFLSNLRTEGVPWLKGKEEKVVKPTVITSKIFGDAGRTKPSVSTGGKISGDVAGAFAAAAAATHVGHVDNLPGDIFEFAGYFM